MSGLIFLEFLLYLFLDRGVWKGGEGLLVFICMICIKRSCALTIFVNRFNDRVQDALVWHDGVRIAGEKVGDGVDRVLARIAEAGLEDEGDDAWEGTGGMYHGVI